MSGSSLMEVVGQIRRFVEDKVALPMRAQDALTVLEEVQGDLESTINSLRDDLLRDDLGRD